jgi:myosin heavy subunit
VGWVWVPHKELLAVPARLTSQPTAEQIVFNSITDEPLLFRKQDLDPSQLEAVSELSLSGGVDNLIELEEKSSGAIVYGLRERYQKDDIYTFLSTILVRIPIRCGERRVQGLARGSRPYTHGIQTIHIHRL